MLQRASNVRRGRAETFPAPSRGWVQSDNITKAPRDAAEVLDNFIPTAQGARLRGGISQFADCGASVVRLFNYASGGNEDFFASTANKIFDLERLTSGSNTFAEVEGLSSGDWSTAQIGTAGGQFVLAVNGTDRMLHWDGSNWNPVVDVAVNDLGFDAESAAFTVGQTVTGGSSGASATILAITKTSATAGTLKLGTITSGPFTDNEAITDGATGAATADGTNSVASAITISGVTTSDLSQVWIFKERAFFVEENTVNAWYLPVESIGGTASKLPLGAVFTKGGSLLFGATWSLDSGSGLDDVCLFVSDQGEVAVYEGTDPASASTWSLVGVYEIGKPLNKHSWFRAGGDLAILTEDGIISVAEALRKDRAALQASAISYPIEDAWQDAIADRSSSFPITAKLWQAQTILLVGTPSKEGGASVAFVANARTGAWGRITGWEVRCSEIYGDDLYFGDSTGKVYKADTGGTDAGTAYTGTYVPKFSPSENLRRAITAGITYRAEKRLDFDMYAHADYSVDQMDVPASTMTDATSTWGSGVWGTFVWGGGGDLNSYTEWQKVSASGYALAPAVRITSNQAALVQFEIMATRLRSEEGYQL